MTDTINHAVVAGKKVKSASISAVVTRANGTVEAERVAVVRLAVSGNAVDEGRDRRQVGRVVSERAAHADDVRPCGGQVSR